MTETLTRAEQPVLDQPPKTTSPPTVPEGDRFLALAWIMGGATSARTAAYFAAVSSRDAHRAPEDFDAEEAERHARLVYTMEVLESEGWTQESARAALGVPEARKPRAA